MMEIYRYEFKTGQSKEVMSGYTKCFLDEDIIETCDLINLTKNRLSAQFYYWPIRIFEVMP